MGDQPAALPSIASIVVATDFSDGAAAAIDWATVIALKHGARIELVHAIDAVPLTSVPLDVQQQAEGRLGEQAAEVRKAGVEAVGTCRPGRAWKVVADVEREVGADFVVIGSRGRTSYQRLWLGSVADRIVRTAEVPVLTVHPEDAGKASLRTVLVATDFSEESLLAADAALRLTTGLAGERRLILLHVCDLPMDYGIAVSANVIAQARADDEQRARAELDRLAERYRSDRLHVDTMVVAGYPATVAQEEAEALGADLVAVGTHGRSGLQHLLLGSIAERVLHHAPCPVLTVRRPGDPRETDTEEAVSE
ncbi:MAG: universal stress protein [Planctomycetes bacterium]|nr:universal stress protein [Planctomycetota bacterium]